MYVLLQVEPGPGLLPRPIPRTRDLSIFDICHKYEFVLYYSGFIVDCGTEFDRVKHKVTTMCDKEFIAGERV